MRRFVSCLVAAASAAPFAASAHHGIANFDLNKEITLTGAVTEVAFVNPHSWLYFTVRGEDGTAVPWRCEMRGSTVLKRSGWSEAMFAPGTQVVVKGAPDRREANVCYLETVTLADGTSMERYDQRRHAVTPHADRPARLANGDPNLNGDWASEQRVMTDRSGASGALVPLSVAESLEPGELPAGARAFPGARGTPESLAADPIRAAWTRPSPVVLTDAGKRAAEGFDPASTDNPRLRCEPTNILFDWTFEEFVNRIVQDEHTIRLLYGAMNLDRTIHLDMTEHPGDLTPTLTGHSIGRWDHDVLIVDTVGFEPGVLSADTRTLHSDRLHVVERFTLDQDKHALRREYTAEDPLYFAGEYRGADTVYAADLPYQAPSCDDRSFVTDDPNRGAAAAAKIDAPAAAQAPAPAARAPARPWWKFWE